MREAQSKTHTPLLPVNIMPRIVSPDCLQCFTASKVPSHTYLDFEDGSVTMCIRQSSHNGVLQRVDLAGDEFYVNKKMLYIRLLEEQSTPHLCLTWLS